VFILNILFADFVFSYGVLAAALLRFPTFVLGIAVKAIRIDRRDQFFLVNIFGVHFVAKRTHFRKAVKSSQSLMR